MSFPAVDWAISLEHEGMESSTKLVLIALCKHADDHNQCWPSINRLSKITCLSPSTVREHIKKLGKLGLIARETRTSAHGDPDSSMTTIIMNRGTSITGVPIPITEVLVDQLSEYPTPITGGGVHRLPATNISKEYITESFDALWLSWRPFEMVNGNKKTAQEKYEKILRSGVSHETILTAAKSYCDSCHRRRTKTQHVVTWLGQNGWESVEPVPEGVHYDDPLTDPRMAIG